VPVRLDPFPAEIDRLDRFDRFFERNESLPAFFEVINRTGFGTLAMTVVFGIGPLYVTIKARSVRTP
jgi:hypothetical protein